MLGAAVRARRKTSCTAIMSLVSGWGGLMTSDIGLLAVSAGDHKLGTTAVGDPGVALESSFPLDQPTSTARANVRIRPTYRCPRVRAGSVGVLDPDGERGVEVVLAVGPERDERLRADDARQLGQAVGDDLGELL